jgi:hypothetical protein
MKILQIDFHLFQRQKQRKYSTYMIFNKILT